MISIYCSVLLKKKEKIKKKKEEKGREICGDINILVCRVRSADRRQDNSRREGRKSKERGVRRKKSADIAIDY